MFNGLETDGLKYCDACCSFSGDSSLKENLIKMSCFL